MGSDSLVTVTTVSLAPGAAASVTVIGVATTVMVVTVAVLCFEVAAAAITVTVVVAAVLVTGRVVVDHLHAASESTLRACWSCSCSRLSPTTRAAAVTD
jgi:hypothetical protein